jgi:hypothetical protein
MKYYSLFVCCVGLSLISACSQDNTEYPSASSRPESGETRVEIQTPGGEISFSSDQPCVTLPGQQFFQFTERDTLAKDGKAVSFIMVLSANGSLSLNFTHDGTNWLATGDSSDHYVKMKDNKFIFKGEAAVLVDLEKDRSEDIGFQITCP